MTSLMPTLPGYRYHEYLLVLSPSENVRNRIIKIRKEFAANFQNTPVKIIRPHITLSRFVTWNMLEEKIIQRFQFISMGITPFMVGLNGFGNFPSHTIYIKVENRQPIINLLKEIRSDQRLLKTHPDHLPQFFTEPHIILASQLKSWQFNYGWQQYAAKHFTAKFIADSMLLLKRFLGDKNFQIVKRFDFLNLPVCTRQGSLFGEV